MSKLYDSIIKHDGSDISITYRETNDYKTISYKELREYINTLSSYLLQYKNKTIAIIGNNKLEYVISLLSIICNIGNAFLIDKELSKEDILNIFKQKDPDLIIIDDDINISFSDYKVLKFSDINRIIKDKRKFTYNKSFSGNLILHTSGTTGEPKCVLLREKNYFGVINELNKKWNVTIEQSCLLIIPLYHIYALTSFFHGLYAGINNIVEWDYKKLNKVLAETKPCLFMGVPLMYNKIKDTIMEQSSSKVKIGLFISEVLLLFHIDARKKIFKKIHDFFGGNYIFGCSAGSMLSYETNKFFNDVGLPIYNVYGMTETSGPIAINYKNNNRFDSSGKILNINKVKIINQDSNGVGSILVKGNNVFDGYLKDKERNCFVGEYFDTGDLGYIKDNSLFVMGRKKNILIGSNGKNLSPEEINNKILKNNKIHDCKVIMENDKLIAVINTSLTHEEVQEYINKINNKLPKYKRISSFQITDKKVK